MRLIPTCDEAASPTLKAVVHGGTALLHILIVSYHLRSFFFHWGHRRP